MVSVRVGSAQEVFNVAKQLICSASPFFKRAFDGPFLEGQEKVAFMLADDPETFDLFLIWLYQGPIELAKKRAHVCGSVADILNRMIDLYIVADKIDAVALQNDVIRAFYPWVSAPKRSLCSPKASYTAFITTLQPPSPLSES